MNKSESIANLAKALAAAQGDIKPAIRDSKNPFFKSTYADLASVFDACRMALADQGVAVVQGASAEGTRVTVTTMLVHESGEWMETALTALAKDEGSQAIGSTITYLRRYSLAAMAGVATEDDDGERGEGRATETRKRGVEGVKQALKGTAAGAVLEASGEPQESPLASEVDEVAKAYGVEPEKVWERLGAKGIDRYTVTTEWLNWVGDRLRAQQAKGVA